MTQDADLELIRRGIAVADVPPLKEEAATLSLQQVHARIVEAEQGGGAGWGRWPRLPHRRRGGRRSGIGPLRGGMFSKQILYNWILTSIATLGIVITLFESFPSHDAPYRRVLVAHYITRAGQRGSITLADNSQLRVGPATRLAITRNQMTGETHVMVTGEVFFRITHHQGTPFIVHTGNTVVRVLGTTFLVRRYPGDRGTRVVVGEGKVVVQNVVLLAHTLGIVTDSGRVKLVPNVTLDDSTALAFGRLVFQHAPLRDVLAELHRAYGVEFRISDSTLASYPFTATIPSTTQSLDAVLESLLEALDAHATRVGRVITVVPGRPVHRQTNPLSSSETFYGE